MLKRLSDGAYLGVVLGSFAVLGLLAGVAWRVWWAAPSGMVYGGQWHAGLVSLSPVVLVSRPNQASAANTLEWSVLAVGVGLIGGLIAALGARGREFAGVAVALIGSAGGALMMLVAGLVGRHADPNVLALSAKDGTVLVDRLTLVEPWLIVLPVVVAGTVMSLAFLGWAASPRPVIESSLGTQAP